MNTTRAYKLRLRREMRLRKKQMGVVGLKTDRKLDKHLFNRLDRLADVKRFVAVWITLVVVLTSFTLARTWSLGSYYQELQPVAGGTYTEGVLGAFTTANPLYASSASDRTAARLLFSGLFSYDENNALVGDLARDMQVDARGQTYTITLRDDVRWHDGQPFTAKDVLFTYKTIQNADAGSPLFSSWQGIAITSPDARTVVFTLSSPLASFPYSLVNGIVPEHILGSVEMTALRTHAFNTTHPVGTGPFMWQTLAVTGSTADTRQEQITLSGYAQYHRGATKLSNFVIKTFRNEEQLVHSYNNRQLSAIAGSTLMAKEFSGSENQYNYPLTAAMMTFFKTSEGVLADKAVRQALVRAVDVKTLIGKLDSPVKALDSPLLPGQVGYDKTVVQQGYDVEAAKRLLDEAGWTLPSTGGVRQKDGQPLSFDLYAENSKANTIISSGLQSAWRAIGVQANVVLQDNADFQTTLSAHTYDALLHGIALGVDPDVYPYWHSSQADARLASRLNFSEYASAAADEALDSGRTRTDDALRAAKYKPFLEAWRDDAPALALYQPQFVYITRETVYGLTAHQINTATDRFSNVQDWMIRRVKTTVD